MADQRVKKLTTIVQGIYDELRQAEDEKLSREQILARLGPEYARFYWKIVGMLAKTRKIVKARGPYGGIMQRHAPGLALKAELNKRDVSIIQGEVEDLISKLGAQKKLAEKDIYKPLQEYLLEKGWFNILEVSANTRKGKKWKNADLYGFSLASHLDFHVGINLRTTAVEVKRSRVKIDHLQQTASGLSFSNSAYLCFFDPDHRANDLDDLIESLKEEEHWQMADQLRIGLIVAYHPSKTTAKLRFQIVREAPFNLVDETAIEDAIKKLLTDKAREYIASEVQKQLRRLVFPQESSHSD